MSLSKLLPLTLVVAAPAVAQSYSAESAPIVTEDVTRFWTAYDQLARAATYQDSLRALFEHYYLPGSPGLHDFIRSRIGSVIDLMDVIKEQRGYVASMRESTLRVREFEPQIRSMLRRWSDLLPDAQFPEIYFLIGRMSSGGTTSPSRILIGTEMYGRTPEAPMSELRPWLQQVLRPIEDVPSIVAHELIHTQQHYRRDSRLLAQVLTEGIADFLGEMLSGGNINAHVYEWADPRAPELWADFQKVMLGTERAGWLYSNRGEGEPNDLGYWMGYQIAKAYYQRAEDKQQAIRDMLSIQDAEAFLETSGYPNPSH